MKYILFLQLYWTSFHQEIKMKLKYSALMAAEHSQCAGNLRPITRHLCCSLCVSIDIFSDWRGDNFLGCDWSIDNVSLLSLAEGEISLIPGYIYSGHNTQPLHNLARGGNRTFMLLIGSVDRKQN